VFKFKHIPSKVIIKSYIIQSEIVFVSYFFT